MFGAILALPALRVTGPYLAMVTLAFGTIIQILINEMTFLTEGPLGIKLPKPSLFGHKLNELRVFLIRRRAAWCCALIVVIAFCARILGALSRRCADSPVASDCMGVSVYRYKVYAFVISAGLAGLAGSLYTYSEAIHFAQHLQLRADDPVSAGCHHGRPQDPERARCSAR